MKIGSRLTTMADYTGQCVFCFLWETVRSFGLRKVFASFGFCVHVSKSFPRGTMVWELQNNPTAPIYRHPHPRVFKTRQQSPSFGIVCSLLRYLIPLSINWSDGKRPTYVQLIVVRIIHMSKMRMLNFWRWVSWASLQPRPIAPPIHCYVCWWTFALIVITLFREISTHWTVLL